MDPQPQPPSSGDPTADATLSLASGLDSVVSARRWVGVELDGVADASSVRDLQLAASELVTNAVQHGDGCGVSLRLHIHLGRVALTVVSGLGAKRRPPPTQQWGAAPQSACGGRGLGIVKAVADRVSSTEQGQCLTVVVERRLATSGREAPAILA